jgi:hypothetical protein
MKKKAKKKVVKKTAPKLSAFVFTGDKIGGCNPSGIWMLGYHFKLNGKPVEVDPITASSIMNNRHFTEAK